MALNAAQLMVTVGANTAAAEQGIAGFARLLGPGGILGLGAVGAAVAVAGIGIASTKMAGDFQAGMLSIVTGAGEAQSNLQLITDGVLRLSTQTGTSTKQLTDGLYMIESAGFHGADGLNILKVAAEGAKVGNADLGTTADALTTILKDYPHVTGGATGAMNLLIATVANGKTHMQDLAGSLSQVLPMAENAGVGLNDVMGAMATMTGEGVSADQAATYLRQTLLMLNAPSKTAQKALAEVGLTTDQVSSAMKKSLPDALQMITDAVGKKFKPGSAEYIAAIKNIVGGTRTVQGMLDLTGVHMDAFKKNVGAVTGAVAKGGDQITGWNLVQHTFNQRLAVAENVVKALMIQIGEKLLPVAGKLMDAIAKNLTPAIDALSGKNSKLSQGLGGDLMSAAKQVAAFFTSDVQPIMKQLGDLWTTTIVPILHTFAEVLTKNVLPAIMPVVHTIATQWLPPLIRIMKDVLPILNPLLQALGWLFQNVIGPGLNLAAKAIGGLLNGIADMTDGVSRFVRNPSVQSFIGLINKMAQGNAGVMNFVSGGLSGVLPHFASGGTMDQSGLALVGEAGPELVRLPGGARVTPMSQVSVAPLGGMSGQPVTINLTVTSTLDGRRVAQSVARHLPYVVGHGLGGGARA